MSEKRQVKIEHACGHSWLVPAAHVNQSMKCPSCGRYLYTKVTPKELQDAVDDEMKKANG